MFSVVIIIEYSRQNTVLYIHTYVIYIYIIYIYYICLYIIHICIIYTYNIYIYIYIYILYIYIYILNIYLCMHMSYVHLFMHIQLLYLKRHFAFVDFFFISFWIITSSKCRSGSLEVFYKLGALKNFAKFMGKHQCWSLFLIRIPAKRPATLLILRLWHRCFSANFEEFLRKTISQDICERLLLKMEASSVATRSEACKRNFCTEELVFWYY